MEEVLRHELLRQGWKLTILPYLLIRGPVARLARGRPQGAPGSKGL
jgi:hypothetical protein